MESLTSASLEMIERLIAFDTTSRDSNLEMIHFIREYLAGLGVESLIVPDETGTKANLYATIGPRDRPGVMLSGHTDVVPVDGQPWTTEPFRATTRDGRIYGRGTCDMKSFIAVALAFAPEMCRRDLRTPVHLAFSYDEEVGCIGVRRLIDMLDDMPVRPAMCIVGEPTAMQVIVAHKGKSSWQCRVRGLERHSSLAPQGVNAVEYAALLIARLRAIADRLRESGARDPAYDVPYATVHTGLVRGGTALNIVPLDCMFEFEVRYFDGRERDAVINEIQDYAHHTLEPLMKAVAPETGITFEALSALEPLDMDPDAEVVTFVKALAERNDHAKIAFGTEAGLFQHKGGIPTVVCGPGDIAQAHAPDEFIETSQVEACVRFVGRLLDRLGS